MKENPIIFSAEMVRAVLDGRKTQTRRVIKPQPEYEGRKTFGDSWAWRNGKDWFSGVTTEQLGGKHGLLYPPRCPYGTAGDRLWVRETFMDEGAEGRNEMIEKFGMTPQYIYRATDYREPGLSTMFKWKPSIFMPRKASRITLEVINVRVERLQEVSEKDALAEGCRQVAVPADAVCENLGSPLTKGGSLPATVQFWALWNSINEARGFGWEKNPWVWVITFRKVEADGQGAA